MGLRLAQIDAFTDRPFAGNPAAVCLCEGAPERTWMEAVAGEMNLSETAFLWSDGEDGRYQLRWYTPLVEVDLCGHATLASAHALWEWGLVDPDRPIRFETRSGSLAARQVGEWIELDFPATPAEPVELPTGLLTALGVEAEWGGASVEDVLVVVESEALVRRIAPDLSTLRRLRRGVIVTAESDGAGFDFVSRFFAPAVGVDEDPVTGSAHCTLGPYWAGRLGRSSLVGYQASARGGIVGVEVRGDRIGLRGQAVTVFEGELRSA